MLPRVVPEPNYPGYDQNGQPRVRYTTTWASRALGAVAQGSYPNSVVDHEKHWEPKNTYGNSCWAFFLALFELACALAFSCLAIYHWTQANSDKTWDQFGASQLLMAGLSTTVMATLSLLGFLPDKRGRVTKRLAVLLSFPVIIQLIEAVQVVSTQISVQVNFHAAVNGFYIAEVILASLLLLLSVVLLFPASEGCAPFEIQTSSALRAVALSVNTVVGAIVLIYFCFSIYGIHGVADPMFNGAKVALTTFAIPITSALLLGILGSFVAISRGIRPHMIPSVVVAVVCIAMFLELTPQYVRWLTTSPQQGGHTGDWHDNAYVGMFALNLLTLVGLAAHVCLGVAFITY